MPVARYRGTEVGYLEERDLEGCKALSEAVVVVTVLLVELLCVSLPYEPEAAVLRLEQDRQTDRQTDSEGDSLACCCGSRYKGK